MLSTDSKKFAQCLLFFQNTTLILENTYCTLETYQHQANLFPDCTRKQCEEDKTKVFPRKLEEKRSGEHGILALFMKE